jgi:glucuronate isomerase
MNVRLVCTTDDPVDSLEHHQKIKDDRFEIPILPAFRPDNAMNVSDPAKFLAYIKKLETITNIAISSFDDFLYALQNRHDFFASMGCNVSDHGLEEIYADDFTGSEIDAIFNKVHGGKNLSEAEQRKFRSQC